MENLIRFLKNQFHVFLLILLLVVSLLIINNNMSYPHYILATITQKITAPIYKSRSQIKAYFYLKEENRMLIGKIQELNNASGSNFLFQDTTIHIYEIEAGDSAKSIKKRLFSYMNATVVFNTTNKVHNYMIIDKGTVDGVEPEMAVISPMGVVGIVDNVSEHFASVVTLLHPNSRLSAKVMPINQIGTVIWDNTNPREVTLHDIPQHLNVEIGNTIFTSGYSTVFPKDILIGTISRIKSNANNSFLNITVELSTPFNNISSVYVVKHIYKEELNNLKYKFKNE